jgi:tetratricopeptide (TPR) repeat protein
MTLEDASAAARQVLATPISERRAKSQELRLEDPEVVLCICETLRSEFQSSPTPLRDEADFLYRFVESFPQFGLFDEREYFLGELALLAGTACRFLFRREETHRWLDRAEARFVLTTNSATNVARLAYQRLALSVEERDFETVLELAPMWREAFAKLELPEEAVKCRFLEAASLLEINRIPEAIEVLEEVSDQAERIGNLRLMAQALNNLARYYQASGRLPEALSKAQMALPILQQLNDRVGLAKLRWCVGDIFRQQRNLGEAVDAYRSGLREAEEIGIRGDVAAIHLVLADVLLDAGFDRQAEWEIRAALPIIEEEKMVPEGYAALALLQESLRRRKIDRQALRNLHGYFQDEKS